MHKVLDRLILIVLAGIVGLTIGYLLACAVASAEEPKMEMSENLSVMVMSDSFDVATGKVKFTVMNWTGNDEARAVKQEEIGRPATTGEIWPATVALENITVEEKEGQSGFDWARANRLNDKGECSKMRLLVSRKVDVDFWNTKLARYKKGREDFLKNPVLSVTEVEDCFPFARIENYPSEDCAVIREYMGQDKASNSPVYKSREARLDGLDVCIRSDMGYWNSIRCVGKLECPLTIAGRYKWATVLLRFEDRNGISRMREDFQKWREARETYKRNHGVK